MMSLKDEGINVWQKAWRHASQFISTEGLIALLKACENDDPKLRQGMTTSPPPLFCVQDWPVEGACPLAFCAWQGDELGTVGEVEEWFARTCHETDISMGEPADVRWFLNWVDETPRAEMLRELTAEIKLALAGRRG